jgi:mRNA interferase RelE/StbE
VTQRRVIIEEPVSLSLGRYFDDAAGLRQVLEAIDALAEDPRPPGSVPWEPVISRLHIGLVPGAV